MSNFGLEQAFSAMGVPFVRANVGDRYVMEELKNRGWSVGGESSGHIVCKHLTSTGDGTISALQVLRAIKDTGLTLHELKKAMEKMPQTMINVRMHKRVDIRSVEEIQSAVQRTEAALGGNGRVLLRPSGTEPLVRVMLEGKDKSLVEKLCAELAKDVENALYALVSQE